MAEIEQKYPIDFRRGGDTVHDGTEKYIKEIILLYNAINSIRGNLKAPTFNSEVATVPNQWYVDANGVIWMRDLTNKKWNKMGENAPYFGAKGSMDAERVNGYVFNLDGIKNRQLIWYNAEKEEFEPAMGTGDTNFEVVISEERTPYKEVLWLKPVSNDYNGSHSLNEE
ncbi:MAG: hypothetical protein J6M62_03615 [Selenomonadaceae bacterium]|nr:hypothetical protein [Selenomonadaceae bacterium]MBO6304154.1 hypothetical protein [Selenomonadaceae bacterium]